MREEEDIDLSEPEDSDEDESVDEDTGHEKRDQIDNRGGQDSREATEVESEEDDHARGKYTKRAETDSGAEPLLLDDGDNDRLIADVKEVIPSTMSMPSKYIPPHLRAAALAEKAAGDVKKVEERRKLERKVQGCLNKCVASSIALILG